MEDVQKWSHFLLPYKFALDELKTKINIMAEEAKYLNDYNPIEHIKTRIKSPESIMAKLERKNIVPSLLSSKSHLFDIAGMRIVCSFVNDIYDIYDQLINRKDIKIMEVKDYIKSPKPNGYQSLHLIVQIPVTLSHGIENVYAEIQLRTLAMDFWASLEHKIYYKYDKRIPNYLEKDLLEASQTAKLMDEKMMSIHDEVKNLH
ncbi:GTP pyrophosphokinase family protein [Brevibacillus laterosporus]|nr:GTP pyrophosphokinase family protein [Brevibacillus laterosporus]TPG71477.1 GTP pyrophosphokinase family protein [Brevibacillus laterosporus]